MRQGLSDRRNRANRRVIIGFLIACLVMLLAGPQIKPVAAVLSPIYVPVDSVVSQTTSDVGAFIGSLSTLPTLQRQNTDLKRLNAQLTLELAQLPLYKRELQAFERELGFADLNVHLDLERASIDGESAPGLPATIDVNAGSIDGVKQENPVLDQNGFLIGKVLHVYPAYSEVGLLTNYVVAIPAMDAATGALGLVQNQSGSMTLNSVQPGHRLRRGDFVVTSAIGNEFPVGLLIGQISSTRAGNALSLNAAPIRTAANLNGVSYVQIVRNFGSGIHARYKRTLLRGGHS